MPSTTSRPPRSLPFLVGAGAALTAGQAVLPLVPTNVTGQVAQITAHRSAEVLSAGCFLLAAILLLWGLNGVRPGHGKGSTLTRFGLMVSQLGALWLVSGRATFNLVEAAVTGAMSKAAAVDVTRAIGDSSAFAIPGITLVALLLGPILFGLGLWRTGIAAWWPALLWLAGFMIVEATESRLRLGPTVGMLMLTAALCAWGRGVDSFHGSGENALD